MTHLTRLTGAILVLGGIGHTAGVARLYLTQGVPDANRVLLDLWIAEAQILGATPIVTVDRPTAATIGANR